MDFWGVKVKSGEPYPVEPGEGRIVHLSQASLGDVKKDKGSESIYLYVTVDGKKLALGTLSPEKFPQQQFDLVFEKKFELSHTWKNGSVYFYGYICDNPFDESEDDFAAMKQKVKTVEAKADVETVEAEDDSSDDEYSIDFLSEASDSYEDDDSGSESVEGETEDDDVDREAPNKVEPSKKRPAGSATETPGPDKKAKLVTPQKTDANKGSVHVATPHPSKQAGKTPGNQSKQQTLKSAESHCCKSCSKSFNSENALQSHTKAKHSAGK